ncbi:MAG TPA: MFS transporter [Methylovirgula sp.]
MDRGLKRVVAAALIGATIEWYDFFLYGVVASIVLNKLYFPVSDPLVSTLLAYATFALGFVARPLGGILFGHFGDRIGRKSMLVITLMVMGAATFLIGLLPTYGQIGVAAPILLLLLRIVQGIGLGGEWGGAVLLAFEYAPPERRGLYASIPQIGLAIGLCLASGIVATLSYTLSDAQFLAFGWRIAFMLSLFLVMIGIYIRINVMETPEFERVKQENRAAAVPFYTMLSDYPMSVIAGMGARFVDGVIFNIFAVFSIGYLSQTLHVSHTDALLGVTVSAIVMCVTIPGIISALSALWIYRMARRNARKNPLTIGQNDGRTLPV